MSDRFYMQQYDRTGWKPVWNNTWIQEKNKLEKAIEAYNKTLVIKPDYAEVRIDI